MFKFKKILIILFTALITLSVGSFAMAQADLGLNAAVNIGLQSGGDGDVRDLIVRIVQYLLTFVGIIATVIILYGGFLWMTAGGAGGAGAKSQADACGRNRRGNNNSFCFCDRYFY